jgi:hypothetical protein
MSQRRVSFLTVFVCCSGGISFAQVDCATATLQGTVFDQQDEVITGATVKAVNAVNGASKTVQSTAERSPRRHGLRRVSTPAGARLLR